MKKILIIGGGFLQDFVICKAKKMGYETYVVDADSNAIGFKHSDHFSVINIVDQEACLEYARNNNIDGVLTAATDYGVLTAAYIAKNLMLPGLDYQIAKLIKNKYQVRKCLFDNHIDDTKQIYEIDENTDIRKLSHNLVFPVMVKPCDGSGSRGASRVNDQKDLEAACAYAIKGSITRKAEIETFIEGKEYGVESLVINNEVYVLGIMEKWMTNPPYYAELGHSIPSGLSYEMECKVKQTVKRAINALGVNSGSVNMDLLIDKNKKIYIVDIGARMGGNMIGPCIIPYGTGIDYMAAMIQNAVGDPVSLKKMKCCAVATKLLAFNEGIIKFVPDISEVETKFGVEIYHHMECGQHVNEYHTNLDGCGYIVAKGNSKTEAIEKAEKTLQYLKTVMF